jgi:hypothetical protein
MLPLDSVHIPSLCVHQLLRLAVHDIRHGPSPVCVPYLLARVGNNVACISPT